MSKESFLHNQQILDRLRDRNFYTKAGGELYQLWDAEIGNISQEQRQETIAQYSEFDHIGRLFSLLNEDQSAIYQTRIVPGLTIRGIHDAVQTTRWLQYDRLLDLKFIDPEELYGNSTYIQIVLNTPPEIISHEGLHTDSPEQLRNTYRTLRRSSYIYIHHLKQSFVPHVMDGTPLDNNIFNEYNLGLSYMWNRALTHIAQTLQSH